MESGVRVILIGFAMGVGWLQQQAVLPGWHVFLLLALLLTCALPIRRVRAAWFMAAAFAIGFGYAAWRAETRLQTFLPTAYEGRNMELTGFVRGLPSPGEESTRFLFEVESNEAQLRDFPRVVQLSWPALDPSRHGPAAVAPPALWAGQRWTLVGRLQRPHGNANFGARDTEASLLARNIRATGYV